jgi:hypothetical protein
VPYINEESRHMENAGRAGEATAAVGHEVPERVRALSALSRIDYVDRFTLGHDQGQIDPERAARAMFGDVPDLPARLLWGGVLGLTLRRGPSAATVAGWRISGRGPTWIRLATASRSSAAELVVEAAPGTIGLVTLMRFDRPAAATLWRPLSAVHRRLAPTLLSAALTTLRRREGRVGAGAR